MKKSTRILSILIIISLLLTSIFIAIPYSAKEVDQASTSASYNLADSVQEGAILQAFNCSYKNIKNKLVDIANAGFTAVQTSPVQQPKDYGHWNDTENQWWKLYQPLSFSIANQSWLGSKSDLNNLCTEAHKYGIKIICDIVVNHMANGGGPDSLDYNVRNYESTIYNNQNTYFHSYLKEDDSSIKGVVHGNIGMPDLNTSNSYVQSRVISLLKECIDCGVDGFRFDAAKHIETPDDGDYSSNFWPNVLTEATNYGKTKNKNMYYYGEILTGCGKGRSYKNYTKYMSVTDNETGNNRTKAVNNNRPSDAAKCTYTSGIDANKAVLWAESHDTYMDGTTNNISQTTINKSFALSAAMPDAATMYLVRPSSMGNFDDTSFRSNSVSAANKFHIFFNGAQEQSSSSGNFAIVERYFSTSNAGIVIVNCSGTSSNISIPVQKMPNGTYKDQVTGNNFTVSNGKISGEIGNTGVAVIYDPECKQKSPSNTISMAGGTFSTSTINITLGLNNATSGTYQIGSQNKVTYTNQTTITIGNDLAYGQSITLKLTATNGTETTNTSYTFIKQKEPTNPLDYSDPLTVYLYNTAGWDRVYLYSWVNGNEMNWPGQKMTKYKTLNGIDMYTATVPSSSYTNIIFTAGSSGPQTDNLLFPNGKLYFDNNAKAFKNASDFDVFPTDEPTVAPTQPPTIKPTEAPKPTSTPTEATEQTKYLYGDVNHSNKIEITDVTLIQQHLANIQSLKPLDSRIADVDGSGKLSITDATIIQQYLANLINEFSVGKYYYD